MDDETEMMTSAKSVRFDDATMWVYLNDGRTLGVPLTWFPRLLSANHEQRNQYRLSVYGIHWEGLDEDLSIKGLLTYHEGPTTPWDVIEATA